MSSQCFNMQIVTRTIFLYSALVCLWICLTEEHTSHRPIKYSFIIQVQSQVGKCNNIFAVCLFLSSYWQTLNTYILTADMCKIMLSTQISPPFIWFNVFRLWKPIKDIFTLETYFHSHWNYALCFLAIFDIG